jgi:hypothetical protein
MALPFYCCPTPYQENQGKKKKKQIPKILQTSKIQLSQFFMSHPNVNPPPLSQTFTESKFPKSDVFRAS